MYNNAFEAFEVYLVQWYLYLKYEVRGKFKYDTNIGFRGRRKCESAIKEVR